MFAISESGEEDRKRKCCVCVTASNFTFHCTPYCHGALKLDTPDLIRHSDPGRMPAALGADCRMPESHLVIISISDPGPVARGEARTTGGNAWKTVGLKMDGHQFGQTTEQTRSTQSEHDKTG